MFLEQNDRIFMFRPLGTALDAAKTIALVRFAPAT
jgi:hypothetical protein